VQARFAAGFDGCDIGCEIEPPAPPTDIAYLERLGALPDLCAVAVAALALLSSLHALFTVGRRSRRPLAVLRALGASRGQVARCMLTQASLVVALALAIGVPTGLMIGRGVWRSFADGLGVTSSVASPLQVIALAGLGIILTAHIAAALPSWLAAGRSPAAALRDD
jgi:ABC-type lipoprotein release transport system permease subunit